MTEAITTGILTLAVLAVVGYLIRLDMADMTGLARKAASEKMQALASELNYQRIAPRTSLKQGGLEKRFPGFTLEVDADKSRMQLAFDRNSGLRLSSLDKNDFDEGGLQPLNFPGSRVNDFFPLRAAAARWQDQEQSLESLLQPLVEQFDTRAVKYLYMKDEYLRIGFHYRHYLPVNVIRESVPALQTFGEQFVNIQKQTKQRTAHGNH